MDKQQISMPLNQEKIRKQKLPMRNDHYNENFIIRHLKNNKEKDINFHANKFNNIDEKDNFLKTEITKLT